MFQRSRLFPRCFGGIGGILNGGTILFGGKTIRWKSRPSTPFFTFPASKRKTVVVLNGGNNKRRIDTIRWKDYSVEIAYIDAILHLSRSKTKNGRFPKRWISYTAEILNGGIFFKKISYSCDVQVMSNLSTFFSNRWSISIICEYFLEIFRLLVFTLVTSATKRWKKGNSFPFSYLEKEKKGDFSGVNPATVHFRTTHNRSRIFNLRPPPLPTHPPCAPQIILSMIPNEWGVRQRYKSFFPDDFKSVGFRMIIHRFFPPFFRRPDIPLASVNQKIDLLNKRENLLLT